jgi:hypothetical protein
MHNLGFGIYRENRKNVENERNTLLDMEYGEKMEKRGK